MTSLGPKQAKFLFFFNGKIDKQKESLVALKLETNLFIRHSIALNVTINGQNVLCVIHVDSQIWNQTSINLCLDLKLLSVLLFLQTAGVHVFLSPKNLKSNTSPGVHNMNRFSEEELLLLL